VAKKRAANYADRANSLFVKISAIRGKKRAANYADRANSLFVKISAIRGKKSRVISPIALISYLRDSWQKKSR
jgi:hypothetical protein